MSETNNIEAAISALEAQRRALGDAVVDAALKPLREALTAAAKGDAEPPKLKQVSILFIDVAGSTAMESKLDPEEISELMDRALRRFTTIVEDRRGRVFNYTGDGLLAAFGADEAREQDTENAVHAGLDIIGEAARLQADFAKNSLVASFKVRAGIDTGPVLLGGGVDGEHNIRGSAVNLAARMEQSAPVGALRVSHNTYRLVRGLFDVTQEAAIFVKGFDEPLRTYLVQCAKPRAFRVATRGIEGLETRMVGRDRELAALQHAFKALHESHALSVLSVVAEAGVGKSRLLYEFENWAEVQPQTCVLLKGRAQPQTQQQPYGLLRDILAWRFQIADNDSAEDARQKLADAMSPMFAGEGDAPIHILGHLIGLDFSASPHLQGILGDPQQVRARAFHAATLLLRQMAAKAPLVLFLDDLHWADEGTLDFLNHLSKTNSDVAILLIAFTRPALFDRRPQWIRTEAPAQRIDLSPLGRDQTRELADVLLQKLNVVPPGLRELITAGSDGNPFFMEETVNLLLDEGAIVPSADGAWRVEPQKLRAVRVPATLKGVLQARLDALAAAERVALQQASVIGFLFWDRALAALDHRSPVALDPLARRGFVVAQAMSALADAREFTFQHHLLHQFIYDSVLKRERRDYHARAAAWLAALAAERGTEYLGLTGQHFERAGATIEAIDYYTRAAESAAARDAREAAFDFAARALALAPTSDHATRWRLFATREPLLALQEDRTKHFAELDSLEAEAEALSDDARRAEAVARRAAAHSDGGEYQKAEALARRALPIAEGAGATAIAARLYGQLAKDVRRMGRFAEARPLAEKGLALARGLGDRAVEAAAMKSLGTILSEQGDSLAGMELTRGALAIFRETGDRVREADTYNSLGDNYMRIGDYTTACELLREGLRLARELGWTFTESVVLLNLATVAHMSGDQDGAVADARAAAKIAAANNARDLEAAAHLPLGLAQMALGHQDAARAALTRSRDLFIQNDGPHLALEPTAALGLLSLAQGDRASALQAANEIVGHLAQGRDLNGTEEPFRIRLSCYQVLNELGDARANGVLVETHAALQAQAARILDDDLRRRFLSEIGHHRAIVVAWESTLSQDKHA